MHHNPSPVVTFNDGHLDGTNRNTRPSSELDHLIFEGLQNVTMHHYDLKACGFSGTHQNCTFYSLYFTGAAAANSRFTDCKFSNSTFSLANDRSPVNFTGAVFTNCTFDTITFFSESKFANAKFINCSFDSLIFNAANLQNARFEKCQFKQSTFVRCDLQKAQFPGCSFTNNDDIHTSGTCFGWFFDNCDLQQASMDECKFIDGGFRKCIPSSIRESDLSQSGIKFEYLVKFGKQTKTKPAPLLRGTLMPPTDYPSPKLNKIIGMQWINKISDLCTRKNSGSPATEASHVLDELYKLYNRAIYLYNNNDPILRRVDVWNAIILNLKIAVMVQIAYLKTSECLISPAHVKAASDLCRLERDTTAKDCTIGSRKNLSYSDNIASAKLLREILNFIPSSNQKTVEQKKTLLLEQLRKYQTKANEASKELLEQQFSTTNIVPASFPEPAAAVSSAVSGSTSTSTTTSTFQALGTTPNILVVQQGQPPVVPVYHFPPNTNVSPITSNCPQTFFYYQPSQYPVNVTSALPQNQSTSTTTNPTDSPPPYISISPTTL